MAVAETAERTARGRTSRRQRFVLASVGEVLRRFVPSRGAGPERADAGERVGGFVSGDFRREGIGAPGAGREAGEVFRFTASAITSTPLPLGIAAFRTWRRGPRIRIRVGDTRKRNRRERPPLEKTRRPFEN
jgi:hypothetical protein